MGNNQTLLDEYMENLIYQSEFYYHLMPQKQKIRHLMESEYSLMLIRRNLFYIQI